MSDRLGYVAVKSDAASELSAATAAGRAASPDVSAAALTARPAASPGSRLRAASCAGRRRLGTAGGPACRAKGNTMNNGQYDRTAFCSPKPLTNGGFIG